MPDLTPSSAPPPLAGGLRRRLIASYGGVVARRLAAGQHPVAPPCELGVDVARHGHERRAVHGGVASLHHASVELLELAAYLGLGGVAVEPGVELGVVLAELEGGREDAGDLLALDQALDPPVG